MNRSKFKENASKCVFMATAIICIIAVVAIFAFLIAESVPAFREIGFFRFIFGDNWDPSASDKYGMPLAGTYGVFKMIVGTLGRHLRLRGCRRTARFFYGGIYI